MDEHGPDTEFQGALTPPPSHPATEVAASAPPLAPSVSPMPAHRRGLRGLIEAALDGLDAVADRIAGVAGLR
jgi:hypothetical protein